MKDYLIVAIKQLEEGMQYMSDIIKADSKYEAFTKYHENRESGSVMVINIVCLTD